MTEKNQHYLNKLKDLYKDYPENYGLFDLASVEEMDNRARELEIYREQPKTQELIRGAMSMYRGCIEKLTNPNMKMNDMEREHCFVAMQMCMLILDIVGENPERLQSEVDKMIKSYAEKVGLA